MTDQNREQIENKIFKALEYESNADYVFFRLNARLEVKRLWQTLYPDDNGWKTLINRPA